jgi:prepilin-type N-terminal cleavage/methylation domain-containing protein
MRNKTDNVNSRRLRSAFSLVELLTVVAIIALLLGILLPAVSSARRAALLKTSQASVNLINAAVEMYANDFDGDAPPSTKGSDTTLPNWKGAELLCLLLTGYAEDPRVAGKPFENGDDLSNDDGKAGFGFRRQQRGKVYGPYNGTEKLDIGNSDNNRKVFIDAFDNPILYYKYDESAKEYVAIHNSGVYESGSGKPGTPSDGYLNAADTGAADVRKDFILVSLGAADEWGNELDSEKQPSNFGK